MKAKQTKQSDEKYTGTLSSYYGIPDDKFNEMRKELLNCIVAFDTHSKSIDYITKKYKGNEQIIALVLYGQLMVRLAGPK